ncbi:hypothetical protein IIE26_20020 [Cytobacillus oceanisediminis]|uniref:hypothetical protein n=1 Tax=Cytobacillus oceanisediminis TaxID=665099 RepID=UPI0018643C8A|nr:hypothetical protein [Cytobacillus oceanisediminis]QOK25941.1 hypothetical protein IIE26_20020 [Cytobacillus oceanisediminis]
MKIKKLIFLIGAVFLFSSLSTGLALAEEPAITEEEVAIDNEMFEQTELILGAIEKIPNGIVKQGPQKTAQWLENKTGLYVTVDSEENLFFSETAPPEEGTIQALSVSGCVAAVGIALVSNGLPFSKILKVKDAIKALGGVTKAVSKIKSYYDKYRYNGFSRSDSIRKALNSASDGLAASTKSALLDFFNLTNVVANCF